METRANYVLVGAFTVIVLIASMVFVYWSANVANQDNRVELLVRIEGSVNGLSVGSQVLFNGLRVGDVRGLRIDPNDPRTVIASTRVDGTTPITTSTRATIGFAGLTGQAFIELKGGSMNERNIIQYAQEQGAVPVIKADPSDVTDILATAKDIADRANNILSQFEAVVNDIGPAVRTTADNITATSQNIKVVTGTLAENSDEIGNFLQSAGRLADSANIVAQELPSTVRSVRGLVDSVDPNNVRRTLENVAAISQTLRDQSGSIAGIVDSVKTAAGSVGRVGDLIAENTPSVEKLLTNLGPLSDNATRVAENLNQTVNRANDILAGVDPGKVNQTIDSVSSFVAGLNEKTPTVQSILDGVDSAVKTVDLTIGNLNGTRQHVDQILAGINPQSVTRAVDNVSQATDNVARAADQVASLASDLGERRGDINEIISNVKQTSAKINVASSRLETVMASVDRFLNEDSTNGLVKTASTSLAAVQDAANKVGAAASNLNANIGPITASVQDFSTRGLGDVKNFVRAATDAVNRLGSAIDSFQANPQRLIFGGDEIKQYNGRNRR
ncbi:organic solvent ABC transporter substrate-binding protein [Aureimonas endophytica]|uniref:Organic solvent ABC transporter substrate-binding protein n=1 Tax=Aureimonas endophytica TaxID=2027858 RepID=A0A916ZF32_9HYPH|nr:MlaD family protein [Aureimonas endophytica]GGD91314.1 organic solvent ABC transporter substrate-binding protein [Aureimonas endophytica]